MMSRDEKNDVSINDDDQNKMYFYSESSNDIRSQYANRPSSPTAGILYTMLYGNYMI